MPPKLKDRNPPVVRTFLSKLDKESTNWDAFLPVPQLSFLGAALTVASASLLCFFQSWWADFALDDVEAIIHNKDLTPEIPVHQLMLHDFWGYNISINGSHKSYRPLAILTLRWNYALSGGLSPYSMHLVNIILHSVVSVLVLKVVSLMFAATSLQDSRSSFPYPRASLLSGVLFAVHPVHTESVVANVGRADLICALFFFLAMLVYIKLCSRNSKNPLHVLLAVICAALSMMGKEHGITVLAVVSIYDYIISYRNTPFEVFKVYQRRYRHDNAHWLKAFLVRQSILVSSTVLLLFTRYIIMGTGVPRFGPDINPASHAAPLTRMLTFPYLYALSSWLLLNPWWLCHDWGEGCIPLISSLDDPRNLATVIFLVLLLLLSYYGIFGGHIESRFVLISLLLVIIPFLPASNIFFYVGFVIAERALYISVFGYAILLVLGINKISQKWYEYNVFIKAVLVLLVVMYVIRSIRRTADWMDDPALHRSAIKVCPLNSKVLFNIGKDLESAGNPEEAIKWYNKTLRLNPKNYGAMLNYGKIMLEKGDVQTAKQLLERSREIQPNKASIYVNLGNLYKHPEIHDLQRAMDNYMKAEEIVKNYFHTDSRVTLSGIYNNQALLKLEMGDTDDAIDLLKKTCYLERDYDAAWFLLLDTLTKKGDYAEVEHIGKLALKEIPHTKSRSVRAILGKVAALQNKLEIAVNYFESVIGLDPKTEAEDYYNLGIIYSLVKRETDAIEAIKKSLQIKPNSENSLTALKNIQSKLKN